MNSRILCTAPLVFAVAVSCTDNQIYTSEEWDQLSTLANPADPVPDLSNKYVGNAEAEKLGKALYFDPSFSGPAQLWDMLGRPIPFARAPLGQEIGVSCNSCHQVDRGGSDQSSVPRHVSIGVGAYDVNGQQTYNAAYHTLLYWNGRNDSLWAQIVAVVESDVSMGGDRLKVAWRLADAYREQYMAVFPDWPLPAALDSVAAQKARLNPDGSCKLDGTTCPVEYCHLVPVSTTSTECLPRFPLRGKPGYDGQIGFVDEGTLRLCHRGQKLYPAEPFNDAFDCMDLADQRAITRIYVNFAKAIAAYEYKLLSRNSPFDRFVTAGPDSDAISPAAQRGAKLFVGKAGCIDCHSGPLLSDEKSHNIGVPQEGDYVPHEGDCPKGGWCDCISSDLGQPNNCLPWGMRDGLRKLQASRVRRDSFYSDDQDCQRHASVHIDPHYAAEHPTECQGRVGFYSVLKDATVDVPKGTWKTPSLRDVALTGPYMHDGFYDTLEQVIWHYNGGGVGSTDLPSRPDPRIRPLGLSDSEIADLVAFLEALTGAPLPAELREPPNVPPASPF